MLKLIQPISKKDQVVQAIKDAILTGSINPGEQIVESRMARELGSGIPLVREALIELEQDGFVQKTPYKGTIVTKLGPKEIREIFQLRVELEAIAVEWAQGNVTPEDIKDLQKLIYEKGPTFVPFVSPYSFTLYQSRVRSIPDGIGASGLFVNTWYLDG